MSEYLWTNTTLNVRRALSSRSGYMVASVSGFSLPDKDHLVARGPQQHGATYVDTFFRPRQCSLTIMIAGCDAEDFQARHVELVRVFNPLDDGVLRIIAEDQSRYTLTCRPVTAIALNRHNARIGEALVQLIADDPFFYTAAETTQFTSEAWPGLQIPFQVGVHFYGFGWESYTQISSGGNWAEFNVDNGGHLAAWPVIVINGPCNNPDLINVGGDPKDEGGETLTVSETIAAGDTLTVDMSNRTAIITSGGGAETNVLGSVSGTWWDIERGFNNIRITSEELDIFNGTLTFSERFLAVA